MIAGPNSTVDLMKKAFARTISALENVAELDDELSGEDKTFLQGQKDRLSPILINLTGAGRAIEDFDLGLGLRLQTRVSLGDALLDRDVRVGNARTKIARRGKPGLGADHAFGKNVNKITNAPIEEEPALVLAAASRLAALPPFPEQDAIQQGLIALATRQQTMINERKTGDLTRDELAGKATAVLLNAANTLASVKGALDERFPRQKVYVASFFLDVSSSPRKKPHEKKSNAILEVLSANEIKVDPESRKKIRGATDLAVLTRWLKRAVEVASVEELFQAPKE